MTLRLDHIVHAVHDPHQAAKTFAERLLVPTSTGGRHEAWGTYNTLAPLAAAYLEWASVFDAGLAADNEFGRWLLYDLERGEGVSQLAVTAKDLDAVADRWRRAGLPFIGPVPGRRVRPDGSMLSWRLLFPARESGEAFPLPFLIEWDEGQAPVATPMSARDVAPLHLVNLHAWVHSPDHTYTRMAAYYDGLWTPPVWMEHKGVRVLVWDLGAAKLWLWPEGTSAVKAEVPRVLERGERVVAADFVRSAEQREWDGQSLFHGQPCLHGLYVSVLQPQEGKS
ncbi:MAG: VOC family protein [Alicyclobacillus herbarius]|uniref:VOC family protein n=1 Tax=Alicyclobacillus herbarius TaxID=122960 RepID=UPI00041539FE|nr:VOC family protein [Alicyclobacillus herbarius]MCL6631869.1 VOC family protein [Alicyclobacillus herbarius]